MVDLRSGPQDLGAGRALAAHEPDRVLGARRAPEDRADHPLAYVRRGPDATEPLADLCDFRRANLPILQFGQQAVERDILRECAHALQSGTTKQPPCAATDRFYNGT